MAAFAPCPVTRESFARIADWLERVVPGRGPPLLVGLGGPGGCGKSALAAWLRERVEGLVVLRLDDFRLSRAARRERGLYGSHPEGNDLTALRAALAAAAQGRPFEQPVYDAGAGAVVDHCTVRPGRIVLAEGELAAHAGIRETFACRILIEAHWRTQLRARLSRDTRMEGGSLEKAIAVFLQSNLRDYPTFAAGARGAAEVFLYRSGRNVFRLRKGPPG